MQIGMIPGVECLNIIRENIKDSVNATVFDMCNNNSIKRASTDLVYDFSTL